MSTETVIRLDHISKVYKLYNRPIDRVKESFHPFRKKHHRDFYALKDISFAAGKGEIVGIVGKNGSGKSTLLKIITRTLMPTSGDVAVTGSVSALLELGAGFNPEYTGIENIYLNGAILGHTRAYIDLRLDEILSFADIGDFVYQPVKLYSSGMLVRLAFSVAVTVDPDILIVDEALAVGDALFQRKCFARIHNFIGAGKTVLFVSHSLDTVAQLCSRAMLLDAGEIILDAPPKLVRAFYFKLLYAAPEEHEGIRSEIQQLNLQPEDKNRLSRVEQEGNAPAAAVQAASADLVTLVDAEKNRRDFFLPDLASTGMDRQKPHDVDIDDVRLLNRRGEQINYLHPDDSYTCSYRVKFNVAASRVTFRIMFKTATDFVICVAEAPGRYPFKYIEEARAGEEFSVRWQFTCNLLAGTYFTNVIVWGSVDRGDRQALSRIADAAVFKVQDIPEHPYQGLMHLEQCRAEIQRIPQETGTPG